MKWTISEYANLPQDSMGNPLPVGGPNPINETPMTGAGSVNLNGNTNFVRFCGDTAAHVVVGAGPATTGNSYVPAFQDYWVATKGKSQLTFIVG